MEGIFSFDNILEELKQYDNQDQVPPLQSISTHSFEVQENTLTLPEQDQLPLNEKQQIEEIDEEASSTEKSESDQNKKDILELEEYDEDIEEQKQKAIKFHVINNLTQTNQSKKKYIQTREKITHIREYQKQLFLSAYNRNSIVYLETGTGKTLIASMITYYYLKKFDREKKIIFLANTVQLVEQQYLEIMERTLEVQDVMELQFPELWKNMHGANLQLDSDDFVCIHREKESIKGKQMQEIKMNKQEWLNILSNSKILIMISQIFLNALRKGYMKMQDVCVIIFDECHHARKQHSYNQIMKEFYFMYKEKNQKNNKEKVDLPVILGLTASPIQRIEFKTTDIDSLMDNIRLDVLELCVNLDSNFAVYDISNDLPIDKAVVHVNNYNNKDYEIEESAEIYETMKISTNYLNFLNIANKDLYDLYKEYLEIVNKDVYNQLSFNLKIYLEGFENEIIKKSLQVYLELGTYCFASYIHKIHMRLKDFFNQNSSLADRNIISQIKHLVEKYSLIFVQKYKNNPRIEMENTSSKFQELIQILIESTQRDDNSGKQMMILIFVKRRLIVKFMKELINEIVKQNPELNDLKAEFILGARDISQKQQALYTKNENNVEVVNEPTMFNHFGQSSLKNYDKFSPQMILGNEDLKEQLYTAYQKSLMSDDYNLLDQIKTVKRFRNKEFHVLISTSVTEEGFDIPSCNIVISYDKVETLQSYIQIKGRARQKDSSYYILSSTEQKKNEVEQKVVKFDNTLKFLRDETQKYGKNFTQSEIIQEYKQLMKKKAYTIFQEDNYEYRIVRSSGALLSTNWSVEILNNFTFHLRRDPNSFIRGPFYYFTKITEIGYICFIILPSTSPKRIFRGGCKSKKEDAKRHAAFEAVLDLYKNKYINENLNSNIVEHISAAMEEEVREEFVIDELYNKIMNSVVKIETENINQGENIKKIKKKYYPQILNQVYDFKFINPLKFINLLQNQTINCQLYLLELTDNKNFLECNQVNYISKSEVGLITCLDDPDVLAQKLLVSRQDLSSESCNIKLIQSNIMLSLESYERYRRIHLYLSAVSKNWDIFYFAQLSKQTIDEQGYIGHLNLDPWKFLFEEKRYYILTTVLVKDENQNYRIDEVCCEKILSYIEYIVKIYSYINKLKACRENEDMKLVQRMNPPYQFINEFREQYKPETHDRQMILQSISENLHMNKVLLLGAKLASQNSLEDSNVENNKKVGSLSKRARFVFQNFGYQTRVNLPAETISNQKWYKPQPQEDYVFAVRVLKKEVKEKTQLYMGLKQTELKKQKSPKFNAFMSEFIALPFNYDFLIKLNILNSDIMYQVRDILLVYHFQKQFLNSQENTRLKASTIQFQPYSMRQKPHLILESLNKVSEYVSKNHIINSPLYTEQLYNNNNQIIQREFEIKFQDQSISLLDNSMLQFNDQQNEEEQKQEIQKKQQLNISTMEFMKALTSKMYNCNTLDFNYEVLEFIGDTVLKLLTTIQIFNDNPTFEEGQIHVERMKLIKNSNLKITAVKQYFFNYILTDKFLPTAPSGYVLINQKYDPNMDEQNYFDKFNQMRHIPDKTLADIVESLNGLFYVKSNDLDVCQFFLYDMGILNRPKILIEQNSQNDQELRIQNRGNKILDNFEMLESKIGYVFNNISNLIEAFTHYTFRSIQYAILGDYEYNNFFNSIDFKKDYEKDPDYNSDLMKQNKQNIQIETRNFDYERFETLGDSVLDLIINNFLLKNFPSSNPGDLSLMKQCIVSNKALSLISMKYDLHYFLFTSDSNFINSTEELKKKWSDFYEDLSQIYLYDKHQNITKILGDIFESLVGAIYFDSGYCYQKTEKIVMNLIEKDFAQHFISPNQMLKLPQFKFNDYMRKQNIISPQIRRTYIREDGKYYFEMIDVNQETIFECYAEDEKEAMDIFYKLAQEKTNKIK